LNHISNNYINFIQIKFLNSALMTQLFER